jgi:chromosome partitioning protein
MPTIISFVNQKGGVGKTTSVINIGAALAQLATAKKKKKRVLIVDMDPQANSSQVLGSASDDDASVYHLLMGYSNNFDGASDDRISFDDLRESTYIDGLDILPANVLLSSAELDLVNAHGREMILKRIFKENKAVLSDYDFVLIDSQPSLGLLTVNSIVASDYVVVPLKADVFSLKGLDMLSNTVTKLQKVFDIETTILGLFFTQVGLNETMFKESYKLCKRNYDELLFSTSIRSNVRVDQANAMDQSIIDFDRKSSSAQDYLVFTKELLKRIDGKTGSR